MQLLTTYQKVLIMTQREIISEPVLNSQSNFNSADFLKEAMAKFQAGQSFTGKNGILTPLITQIVNASLDAEMEQHLDECKVNGASNRRNGRMSKILKTADGSVEIETPRDRAGTFEPQLVKKRQTILNDSLDDKIIGLYGLGMSYEDIRSHMQEMYGVSEFMTIIRRYLFLKLENIPRWANLSLRHGANLFMLVSARSKIDIFKTEYL
jgi:putative transposase